MIPKISLSSLNKNIFSIIGLLLIVGTIFTLNYPKIETYWNEFQVSNSNPEFVENGQITSWGLNMAGQLGNGKTSLSVNPDQVSLEKLAQKGEPFDKSWTSDSMLQAANNFSLYLDSQKNIYSWGYNLDGQLGLDNRFVQMIVPTQVKIDAPVKSIKARNDHSMALDENGDIWSWGVNYNAQLGDGSNQNSIKPIKIKDFSEKPIVDIAVGYRISLALDEGGEVWGWGGNCGQRETAQFEDFTKSLVGNIDIAGGYFDPTGGNAASGFTDCLGEEFINISSSVPIKIDNLSNINALSAGYGHILALNEEGDVYSWGCNLYGQVGNGTNVNGESNSTPQKIDNLGQIKMISAGFRHSMALTEEGDVYSWGYNFHGELGLGDTTDVYTPTQILGLKDIVYISAGHDYSLAIDKDGKLYSWGENNYGQLGKTEDVNTLSPKRLWSKDQFIEVHAGYGHVLALSK